MPLARLVVSLLKDEPEVLEDPLTLWLTPMSAKIVRQLEFSVQRTLLGLTNWKPMERHISSETFSDIAAFFYVALFRTVRDLISGFRSSNPTWTKAPDSPAARVRPKRAEITTRFLTHIQQMENAIESDQFEKDAKVTISLAASQQLPLAPLSVDFVLSSPPYCTRIDYAAATRPELAVLGVTHAQFSNLRRTLLGGPTVPSEAPSVMESWGKTCERFIEKVRNHPSKASSGYYLKSHCQYFAGLHTSIGELQRCLKPRGRACLVVQDSFYKDVHNDLPQIFCEMATNFGLTLEERRDFAATRNIGRVNALSRRYRTTITATESVLLFKKY